MDNKNRLIQVFDENALAYDTYRPKYPSTIIETIIHRSNLKREDKIVEIGCGTGQITVDFLRKGFNLLAIEKGASLSKLALKNIAPFQNGKVINTTFEKWKPSEKFKVVLSAQAFHWIEKKAGMDKISNLLEKDGSVALVWNVDASESTTFWEKTKPVYDKYFPVTKEEQSLSAMIDDIVEYLQSRTDFGHVERIEYLSEKIYSKEDYLGLLSTYSNHMALEKEHRDSFFHEIANIIQEHGNCVQRNFRTILVFARSIQ